MGLREALSEDRASPIDLFEREPLVAELVAYACQLQPGDAHIRMIGTGHGGVDLETALRRVEGAWVVPEDLIQLGKIAEHGPDVVILLAEIPPQQRQRLLVRVFRIAVASRAVVNRADVLQQHGGGAVGFAVGRHQQVVAPVIQTERLLGIARATAVQAVRAARPSRRLARMRVRGSRGPLDRPTPPCRTLRDTARPVPADRAPARGRRCRCRLRGAPTRPRHPMERASGSAQPGVTQPMVASSRASSSGSFARSVRDSRGALLTISCRDVTALTSPAPRSRTCRPETSSSARRSRQRCGKLIGPPRAEHASGGAHRSRQERQDQQGGRCHRDAMATHELADPIGRRRWGCVNRLVAQKPSEVRAEIRRRRIPAVPLVRHRLQNNPVQIPAQRLSRRALLGHITRLGRIHLENRLFQRATRVATSR